MRGPDMRGPDMGGGGMRDGPGGMGGGPAMGGPAAMGIFLAPLCPWCALGGMATKQRCLCGMATKPCHARSAACAKRLRLARRWLTHASCALLQALNPKP
jgi:hypothetical protein